LHASFYPILEIRKNIVSFLLLYALGIILTLMQSVSLALAASRCDGKKEQLAYNLDPSTASSIQDKRYISDNPRSSYPKNWEIIGRMSAKQFWRMTKGKVLEGVFGNPLPVLPCLKYQAQSPYSHKQTHGYKLSPGTAQPSGSFQSLRNLCALALCRKVEAGTGSA
jgi:hypothetical protein